MPDQVARVVGETQTAEFDGRAKESQGVNANLSHAGPVPMHVERENDGGSAVRGVDEEAVLSEGNVLGSKEVGPEVVNKFKSGLGEKCGRPKRRSVVGQKSRKAHLQSKGISAGSPSDLRPNKRSRNFFEDSEPGFGFVGFADKSISKLDLNSMARSSETVEEASQLPVDGVTGPTSVAGG
ncbi:hypothetical protein Hanom_Chr14g01283381 [Helianthus anomalus]